MDEQIGKGYIDVELRDNVARDFARINAEISAEMDALSRKKAEISIKGNISDLKRASTEARAELAKLEAEEKARAASNLKLAGQEKRDNAQRLADLRQSITTTRDSVAAIEAQRTAQTRLLDTSRRQGELDRTLAKEKQQQWKAEATERKARLDQQKIDERFAESHRRADLDEIKRRQEIIRLQQAYNKAAERARELESLPRRQRDQPSERIRIQVDSSAAKLQMLRAEEELRLLAAKPIKQDLTLNDHGAIDKMRNFVGFGRNQAGPVDQFANAVGNLGEKFKSGNVNIGPFSGSIATLTGAFAALSPVITGLLGGVGALIAQLGAGVAGAAGVGAAGLTGFGLAAVGIKSAISNQLQQLTTFKSALSTFQTAQLQYGPAGPAPLTASQQRAAANRQARVPLDQQRVALDQRLLTDAVAQYGSTSLQASRASLTLANAQQSLSVAQSAGAGTSNRTQKALDKLNSVVAQSDPAMRAAMKSWFALSTSWQTLTGKVASRDLGAILAGMFQTANANISWYARDTNKAMDALTNGLGKLFAGLRTTAARDILHNIFDNFNKSIPNILAGLGSLASAFGRITSQFSNYLPGLTKGFAQWAQHIADSAKNSNGFANGVHTMVQAMRDFGHFAQAAASWLITFFSAGVGPGAKLMNDFTAALNRSNEAMKTTEKGHLADFFRQGVLTLENLVSLLAPFISLLAKLAQALAPALNLTLQWAGAIANVVSAFLTFKPLDYAVGILALVALTGRLTRGFLDAGKAVFGLGTNIKNALTGGGLKALFGSGGGVGAQMAEGGTTAAAEMRAGIVEGGTQVAAELRAAMAGSRLPVGGPASTATKVGGGAVAAESAIVPAIATSIAGPVAIAAAPLVAGALGLGLVKVFDHASEDFGRKLSHDVFKAFGTGVGGGQGGGALAHNVQTSFSNISAQQSANAANLSALGRVSPAASSHGQVAAAGNAALDKQYRDAGQKAAAAFQQGLSGVPIKTEGAIFQDFNLTLGKLPTKARNEAAKSVIGWVQGLETNGQIAKGSTRRLIGDMERQFPGFATYLKTQGLTASRNFATAFQLGQAQNNVKGAIQDIRNRYGLLTIDPNVTGKNLLHNVNAEYGALKDLSKGTSGQIRRDFTSDMQKLHDKTISLFGNMVDDLKGKQNNLKDAIIHGSGEAKQKAGKNYADFQQAVADAMASGVISSSEGAKLMAQALNSALAAFGGKPVPAVASITAGVVTQAANSATSAIAGLLGVGHATGGLVQVGHPGAAGKDNIPVNAGGARIVVGAGEQIAVFNRHQQAVMNHRLADMGGLPGMFQKVNTPHYMATGGWVNAVASAEVLGGKGYHDNPIVPDGYSELGVPPTAANVGTALGRLPFGTHMRIRSGQREVVAAKEDIGTGSSFNPIMGLYPGTQAKLGLSGGQFNVQIQRADGAPLTAAGAGQVAAAIAQLSAPTVHGAGTVAKAVRAGLQKVTDAANAYLTAQAPKSTASGGVGSAGPAPMSGPAAVQAMVREASLIDSQHFPYVYGGGHGSFNGPYDCSGAVSAVLHAAGLLGQPEATGALASFGSAGPGKNVSIYVENSSRGGGHTIMSINGHLFGTSNGQGGNWLPGGSPDSYSPIGHWEEVRHPTGLAKGGLVDNAPAHFRDEILRNRGNHRKSQPGMAGGGMVNKPTMFVGEENRPEFVISTNPAYRNANLGYLMEAAQHLGVDTAAAGIKPKKITPHKGVGYPTHPLHQSLDDKYAARHRLSARAHHGTAAIEPLPPSARIGPNTDTTDLTNLIGNETSDLGRLVAARNRAHKSLAQVKAHNARVKERNARARVRNQEIAAYNRNPDHRIKHRLIPMEPYLSGHGDGPQQSAINAKQKDIGLLKQFLSVATEDGIKFNNLETEISTLDTALQTADLSPDGSAFYNGKNRSWNELKGLRDKDVATHTKLLKDALAKAKKLIGKNPSATNTGFVKALEGALGTSILTQLTDAEQTKTAKSTAITMEDFVAYIGKSDTLANLNYASALASTNNVVDNPSTPAREDLLSLVDDKTAASNLMGFYQDVLGRAQSTHNVPLMTEAATAFGGARDTYLALEQQFTDAASATGPGQVQLYEGARANLLQAFGSNVALPAFASGGLVNPPPAMPASQAPSQGHTVNNYFSHQPDDPHTWSQGIAWELGAIS